MISEASRRSQSFRGEVPVTLGDGQTWYVPAPRILARPRFDPDGRPTFRDRADQGGAYDAFLDEFWDAETGQGQLEAVTAMVRLLLLRNYELTDDEVGGLLVWDRSDPANDAMWRRLTEVATGGGPKPTPDGGGPSG